MTPNQLIISNLKLKDALILAIAQLHETAIRLPVSESAHVRKINETATKLQSAIHSN